MNTAFIFPGQGSQVVGMAKDLYDNFAIAREVFNHVNESLQDNLTKKIFEGPIEELTLTQNTQPALMAVSMAFLAAIKHESGKSINELCNITAGHSVGEYSALCASDSISIHEAAKILRVRGNAMQNSCPKDTGAMAACLGLSLSDIEKILLEANKYGICDIANDNTDSQVVISGEIKAVDIACILVKDLGGKAIKLNVSGPFHSRLMLNAEMIMKENLELINFNNPLVPIILNVTAQPSTNIEEIKSSLVHQISGRVRWREIISFLKNNDIDNIVEIGSGKVLTTMLRKIEHKFLLRNVGNILELQDFLSALS